MLDQLAGTAGLAIANVRLAYDLRRRLSESLDLAHGLERSRQRLLEASAQQTRRFSSRVEALVLSRLETTRAALDRAASGDPSAVDDARDEATMALAALRELASGVFPPGLADRGLANALESYCARFDGRVGLTVTGDATRAPFGVEAAAYFCAVQVVEDAVTAGPVRVELRQDVDLLQLQAFVGTALDDDTIQLLRDRVEASEGALGLGATREGGLMTVTLTWGSDAPAVPAGSRLAGGAR